MLGPIRLLPDNFTPTERTPWGGTRLARVEKADLGLRLPPDPRIGESWELSAGVELPSRTPEGRLLADVLAEQPTEMLGEEAERARATTALIVKWLDAGDDLSLQLHPPDHARGLAPDEAGKVEAWYVTAHAPDAHIYLGFRAGTRERDVRLSLERGEDLSRYMAKRTVAVGDLFVLVPGTPHAVGRGITLLEPQHVDPSKRALTYRYWDWNRRYDASGRLSSTGAPRALHVEQALAHTRWDRVSDAQWLDRHCGRFGVPELGGTARSEELCGPEEHAALRSSHLRIARLSGNGPARLPAWRALRSVTVLEGAITLGAGEGAEHIPRGCTVAVPAACSALSCRLEHAHVLVCAVAC